MTLIWSGSLQPALIKSWKMHRIKPVPWQHQLDKWSGDMRRISHVDCLITDICLSSLTPVSDLIRGFGEYRMPLSPMAARRL